jgi:hypothetical protein
MEQNIINYYPDPTPTDQIDFLFRLYFGSGEDLLACIINRAHRDLSRTVHGIGKYPEVRQKAANLLKDKLEKLACRNIPATQSLFDIWHQDSCEELCQIYLESGYDRFTVGQGQKWINMALKYIFLFGEARLSGYELFYKFAHIPIDNIILESPEFEGLKTFRTRWSRITKYSEYLAFQEAVRRRFVNSAPLAVEFRIWQDRMLYNKLF